MATGFTNAHITNDLFQKILLGINKDYVLKSWKPFKMTTDSGYTNAITADGKEQQTQQLAGVYLFKLEFTVDGNDEISSKNIALKSKPKGSDTLKSILNLMPEYSEIFRNIAVEYDFPTMHQRELECVTCKDDTFKILMPDVYWSLVDGEQDIHVFAMDYFGKTLFSHIDTVNIENAWNEDDILKVLKGISVLHGKFYGNIDQIPQNIKTILKEVCTLNVLPSLKESLQYNKEKSPHFWTEDVCELAETIFDNISEVSEVIQKSSKTFCHGDFCPLNICLRHEGVFPNKTILCLYDWEYSFIAPPQYDLAMFLLFAIPENTEISVWDYYIKKYYDYLKENMNIEADDFKEFVKIFDMGICDMFVNFFNWVYAIWVHIYKPAFAQWVYGNLLQLTKYIVEKYQFKKKSQ